MQGRRQSSLALDPEGVESRVEIADPSIASTIAVNPRTTSTRPQSKKTKAEASYDLNVLNVVLGTRIIKPLYPSLYRAEIVGHEPAERLFVCERCYKYTVDPSQYLGHARFCEYASTIPGRLIYSKGRYSIYELDGEEYRLFAQNLSLFTKLFIETKSVCFEVRSFLYYLLVDEQPQAPENVHESRTRKRSSASVSKEDDHNTRPAQQKAQIVAFFSKEKLSWDNNNVACILVFPPWQKRGLGQLLVGISYELSRREGRLGGPEKPLSAPGARSYTLYWCQAIARTILALPIHQRLSINDISESTFILQEDVIGALMHMEVLLMPEPHSNGAVTQKNAEEEAEARGKVDDKHQADDDIPRKPVGARDIALASFGKITLKKAQGAVLVDRAAVKRWLAKSAGTGSGNPESQVDRDAFVEGAFWGAARAPLETEGSGDVDVEMED